MKKSLLLMLILTVPLLQLYPQTQSKFTSVSFSTTAEASVSKDAFKTGFSTGMNVHGKDANLALYLKQNKLPLSQYELLWQQPLQVYDFSWGIKKNQKETLFSLESAVGNLSLSGAVSRMKRPYLVFSSAMYRTSLPATGLQASIPSGSSTSPVTLYFKFGTIKNDFFPYICVSLDKNFDHNISIYNRFQKGYFQAESSFTYSGTLLNKEASSSWILSERPVPKKIYHFFNGEINMTLPHLRSGICTGINEEPYGKAGYYLRSCTGLTFNNLSINGAVFFSTPNLFTASGTTLEKKNQFMINATYGLKLYDNTFKTGILFQQDQLQSKDREKLKYLVDSYKLELDWGRKNYFTALKLNGSFNSLEQELTAGGKISVSRKNNGQKLTFSTGYDWTRQKQTAEAGFSFSDAKGIIKNAGSCLELNIKNGQCSSVKFTADAAFSGRIKGLKYTANISFSASL